MVSLDRGLYSVTPSLWLNGSLNHEDSDEIFLTSLWQHESNNDVKNTIVEALDMQPDEVDKTTKGRPSDSDVSLSSVELWEDTPRRVWLPSLSSQSSNSSRDECESILQPPSTRERNTLLEPAHININAEDFAIPFLGRRNGNIDSFPRAPGMSPQTVDVSVMIDKICSMSAFQPMSAPTLLDPAGTLGFSPIASLMGANPTLVTGLNLVEQIHAETGVPIPTLQALEQDGVLQQIRRNNLGEWASVGSIKHEAGLCSPCLFWFRNSCSKGITCTYCHFRHLGQKSKRIRPSRKARLQMRAEAESQAMVAAVESMDGFDDFGNDDE
mmetsp:Transcript_10174/g.26342  ORF Transcript_10174/g.26342 Transcript_10174/m.26342 type:complete len:326 (+) Transcript_10174:77-1054(+)